MNIPRILNLPSLLNKKSFFLLGPRQTGKTHLIKTQLKQKALFINLLDSELSHRLHTEPSYLKALVDNKKTHQKYVVIDEVQKNPELLNLVHLLIEEKNTRFLLTGSSSRKLKKKSINLLAGRARNAELFSLSWKELGPLFQLDKRLLYGSLPYVYLSKEPREDLKAYVSNYLILEAQTEALTRSISNFHSFLRGAALSNTQILNFAKLGNDFNISPATVRDYYSVLQDMLLGFMVPAYKKTPGRKTVSKAKFFFFDIGLVHVLCEVKSLNKHSDFYGRSFEHFIASEIRAYLSYFRKDDTLCYWQSRYGQEVDFIIGDHTALEVKASQKASKRDIKSLRTLKGYTRFKKLLLISQDEREARFDGIQTRHWKSFLTDLWSHKIF